jgi:hypothetical protein
MKEQKRRWKGVLAVGLAGGLGGAINAALCYFQLPVPIVVDDSVAEFSWHIIPAGAVHGATLAALTFGGAILVTGLGKLRRCGAAVIVGWVAGYFSAIPLQVSAFDNSLMKVIAWPFGSGSLFSAVWSPFAWFGGIALLLSSWLLFRPRKTRALEDTLVISLAAILGSLWWWIEWQRWYFSPLHGAIWGTLVSLGARGVAIQGQAAEQSDAPDEALHGSRPASEPRR